MLTEQLGKPAHAPETPPATAAACIVCGGRKVRVFFEVAGMPVNSNILWSAREAARACPRGDIRLGFCPDCGLIRNLAFDPVKETYDQSYENSLHFSPRFQSYAESLARELIERYGLRGKDIIELGCGKGDFLALLCALGNNRGAGFDASYVPGRADASAGGGVRFVQDYYSLRYAHYPCDLLCCRHVLEHIADPAAFLADVRRALQTLPHAMVYFEVPNGLFMFRALSIWDIIYEHCSYFTAASLERLFTAAGFEALDLRETFDGQFLAIDARLASRTAPSPGRGTALAELACDVEAFGENYRQKVGHWNAVLGQGAQQGRKLVLWGGGAKGAIFANTFQAHAALEYVVDLNPHKQGHYIGGTGQKIVPPEFLKEYRPDAVIVMNPIYQGEIAQRLASLGVKAGLLTV